jgi:hypothetical protein
MLPFRLRFRVPAARGILGAAVFLAAAALRLPATTVVPPEFEQLVNESDYVIRATVKAVTAEVQTTAAGGRKIVTRVELGVNEVLAGAPPEKVVLRMLGGKVGDEEMVVEGAPRFTVGEEDVLFVRGNGQAVCPLTAMMHGRYRVERDAATGRAYLARENRVPLTDVSEVSQAMAEGSAAEMQRRMKSAALALSPAEFAQRVRAAVKPGWTKTPLR